MKTTKEITELTDAGRRQFLKGSAGLSFTAIAASSLPMSLILSGCNATFYRMKFINWSENIQANNMLAAKITNEADAETVVQWAVDNNHKVRPMGQMHNWSPTVIAQGTTSAEKILLIDASALNQLSMQETKPDYGIVKVGAGTLVEDLYQFLSDDRSAGGSSNGYAFQNTPAPGDITVAGMLAINGHGTGVPYAGSNESDAFNGSLSNTVLSLRAIVWNASTGKYQAKTFHRDDADCDVFLTHLGRLLITEVTMQAVPNYNLRCLSYTNTPWQDIFHSDPNNNPFTIANLLDNYGRLETIWFPFTNCPWLKVWVNSPNKPAASKATSGPYNYPFSDQIPVIGSRIIKSILNHSPELVPAFGKLQYGVVNLGLNGLLKKDRLDTDLITEGVDTSMVDSQRLIPCIQQLNDIWGPAWHTLLYVRKTTLRVTANGYAIHVPRAEVQSVISSFVSKYQALAETYAQRGLYPMAGPMEIRVTGLEDTSELKTRNGLAPKPPSLSSLTPSAANDASVDTAIWLDLLTLPGAPAANELYEELEIWLFDQFPAAQIRVEWSKGWGYTNSNGAWSNSHVIDQKIPAALNQAERSFASTVQTMQSYDPQNIYSNSMLDNVLKA